MRNLALLLVAACSSKSSAPPPAQGSAGSAVEKPAPKKQPPIPAPSAIKETKPIDLPDTDITELQLAPTDPPVGQGKVVGIFWRSEQHGPERRVADMVRERGRAHPSVIGIVCRVESYNLYSVETFDIERAFEKGQHGVYWSPYPFAIEPELCEVRFLDDKRATFASACYRAGNMTVGPCPEGSFPPPKLDPGQVLDIQGATVTAFEGGVRIKALYTVAAPLEHVSFDATCDGVKTTPTTEEASDIPLAELRPGETTAGEQEMRVDKKLAKSRPDKCELRASVKGKRLATFCIAEGQTDRGPCPR
jgi:hypothetical protein